MKILDSDHCVAILRGQLDPRARVAPTEVLALTAISLGELTHGAHKSMRSEENLARLEVLAAAVVILPYDTAAARLFGLLKAQLERDGSLIPDLDLQIGSIALAHNLPLVTHNQRHYARLPGLDLEDWLA